LNYKKQIMKKSIFIFGVILSMVFISCEKNWMNKIEKLYKQNEKKVSIKEGIYGTVAQREGDCMFYSGKENPCKLITVERTVYFYVDTINTQEPDTLLSIGKRNLKLIKTVVSDKKGFFQAELPPGIYSIAIEEEDGNLYSDDICGQNSITVETGKVSMANFTLDHAIY